MRLKKSDDKRLEAEQNLKKLNQELENRIDERTYKLKENEERTRHLLESISEGIIGVDQNGIVSFANDSALTMLGYKSEEIIGKEIHNLIHHSNADGSIYYIDDCPIYKTFKKGEKCDIENEVLWTKQGINFSAEYSSRPMKNDNGEITGSVISFRNTTEKRELEKQLKLIQHGIDNASDAVWWIDPENARILQANKTSWKSLGYTQEEFFKMTVQDIDPDFPKEKWGPLINILKTGQVASFESRHKKKNGEIFPIDVNSRYIEFEGKGYVISFTRDITEKKKAEETAKQSNALQEHIKDVERFNALTQGRELRIIDLKQQINKLLIETGKSPAYDKNQLWNVQDVDIAGINDEVKDDILFIERTLKEITGLSEVDKIFSSYCDAVGVPVAIIDLKGNVLVSSRWQRICTDFHRINESTCKRCIESDTELAVKLNEGKSFSMYTCKNGLTDCASPLIVEGKHIANVFIGQFHIKQPDITFFRKQAEEFGFPMEDYLKAVMEAPVLDSKILPNILDFLTNFTKILTSLLLERYRAESLVEKMKLQSNSSMSLAEDAEKARLEIEEYKEHLEELIKERTNELIEEREKLIESQENIRRVLESAPVGLAIVDLENAKTLLANKAMGKIFDIDYEEIFSINTRTIYANPEDAIVVRDEIIKNGSIMNKELLFRKINSKEAFWAVFSMLPIKYFDYNSVIVSFIDITEMKELQIDIENARKTAEEASKIKSQFISNLSHELRTPLNIISGNTQLIKKSIVDDNASKFINRVENSVNQLNKMINNILDFSLADKNNLELEIVDFSISDLFNTLCYQNKKLAQEKGLKVICEYDDSIPRVLKGDSKKLTNALSLLIDNAIKFTNSGFVSLTSKLLNQNDNYYKIKFTITDSGIGIAEEKLKDLFSSFTQLDGSSTRQFGGIGLGLALCNNIIKLMGGEIGVESELNKGSSFSFELDFMQSEITYIPPVLDTIVEEDIFEIQVKPVTKIVSEVDKKHIKVLLEELSNLLREDDFEAIQKVDNILGISGEFFILELSAIKKSVEDYDFEKALELTNNLIESL
jgi:PAS domain S-box-containing protein